MTSDTLTLKILTPQGIILDINGLISVTLPLLDQIPIGIRPGHAPLIAETSRGKIKYRSKDEENEIVIDAGVVKIRANLITILTSGKVNEEKSAFAAEKLATYDRLMSTLMDKTFTNQSNNINIEINDPA